MLSIYTRFILKECYFEHEKDASKMSKSQIIIDNETAFNYQKFHNKFLMYGDIPISQLDFNLKVD